MSLRAVVGDLLCLSDQSDAIAYSAVNCLCNTILVIRVLKNHLPIAGLCIKLPEGITSAVNQAHLAGELSYLTTTPCLEHL